MIAGGITLLAGKAVGAPFVGSVAACLAIAEVLRLLHGQGQCMNWIELDLQAVEHRTVVPHPFDFTKLNPGYVFAAMGNWGFSASCMIVPEMET